jgi:hypothetical protein
MKTMKTMKLRLHKLAIRFGLYTYHTSGCSLEIGRTWFGVWFLEGDYMPKPLNECVHFQVGEALDSLGIDRAPWDERYSAYIPNPVSEADTIALSTIAGFKEIKDAKADAIFASLKGVRAAKD